ncbi:hypothetical protein WJ438_07205 [Streptomyces sp. GD-15H]|uniref:hypothetical protein n=1 Tax=Streptomyces sp. GD-15H TaxID=3129112 RepID=UPI00324FFBF8
MPQRGRNDFARVAVAKYGLLLMLTVEIVAALILAPKTFGSTGNINNILASQAILMIVTLSLTMTNLFLRKPDLLSDARLRRRDHASDGNAQADQSGRQGDCEFVKPSVGVHQAAA